MRRVQRFVAAVVALLMATGCASTPKVQVVGRTVTVEPDGEERKVRGELLVVGPERLWVRESDEVAAVPLHAVQKVNVKRHSWDAHRAGMWSLIGGLVTGGALTGACGAADADNCGVVGLITLGVWVLFGLLAAPSMESSSRVELSRPTADELRPFARFPQGWPEGVTPDDLARPE
jgi:hypothetical protein